MWLDYAALRGSRALPTIVQPLMRHSRLDFAQLAPSSLGKPMFRPGLPIGRQTIPCLVAAITRGISVAHQVGVPVAEPQPSRLPLPRSNLAPIWLVRYGFRRRSVVFMGTSQVKL